MPAVVAASSESPAPRRLKSGNAADGKAVVGKGIEPRVSRRVVVVRGYRLVVVLAVALGTEEEVLLLLRTEGWR